MCKLNNIKNKEFIIYYLVNNNYVGVTTNLHKRLLKHKSKSNFNIDNVKILYITKVLKKALNKELEFQKYYKCSLGVRNQEGVKNPYAKTVLHTSTGVYFDTIKDACDTFGFNYSYVRHAIKNNNNKFNLIRL